MAGGARGGSDERGGGGGKRCARRARSSAPARRRTAGSLLLRRGHLLLALLLAGGGGPELGRLRHGQAGWAGGAAAAGEGRSAWAAEVTPSRCTDSSARPLRSIARPRGPVAVLHSASSPVLHSRGPCRPLAALASEPGWARLDEHAPSPAQQLPRLTMANAPSAAVWLRALCLLRRQQRFTSEWQCAGPRSGALACACC